MFYSLQSNTRYFVNHLERFTYHCYIYICIYSVISNLRNIAYLIETNKLNRETQVKRHINPIECTKCREFSTAPAVFFMTPNKTARVVENCRHPVHSVGPKRLLACVSLLYIHSIVIFHICMSLFESTLLSFCKPLSKLDLPTLRQGSRERAQRNKSRI